MQKLEAKPGKVWVELTANRRATVLDIVMALSASDMRITKAAKRLGVPCNALKEAINNHAVLKAKMKSIEEEMFEEARWHLVQWIKQGSWKAVRLALTQTRIGREYGFGNQLTIAGDPEAPLNIITRNMDVRAAREAYAATLAAGRPALPSARARYGEN